MPKQLEFRYVFQSAAVKENTVNVFGETGTLFEKGTDYDELITLYVPKEQLSNLILYYNGVTPDGMVGAQDPSSLRSDNAPVDISTIATWTKRVQDATLPQTNENGYYYFGDVILFQKDGSTSKSCWTCIKTTSAPTDPIPALGTNDDYYWPLGRTAATGGIKGGYYGYNRISQPYIANVPPQTISPEKPGSAKYFEAVSHSAYWQESKIASAYTADGAYYTDDLVIYNDTVYKVIDTNGGKVKPSLFKKGPEQEGVTPSIASLVDAPNGAYGFDWQGNRYIEGVAPNGDLFSQDFWRITTLPRVPTSTYTFLNWDNVKVHDKIEYYDDNIIGFKNNQTSNTFMDDVGVDIYTLSSIYNANSKGFSLARAEKILASIPAAAIKSQLVANGLAVDYTLDQMVHSGPVKTTPFNYAPTVQGVFEDALAQDMMRTGGPLTSIHKIRVTRQSMGFQSKPTVVVHGDTLATNPEYHPTDAIAKSKLGIGLITPTNSGSGYSVGDKISLNYDLGDPEKDVPAEVYVYGVSRVGAVLSLTITNPGSGYNNVPSLPDGVEGYIVKSADGSLSKGTGLELNIKMTLVDIDLNLDVAAAALDDGSRLKIFPLTGNGLGGYCTVQIPDGLTQNPRDGIYDLKFAFIPAGPQVDSSNRDVITVEHSGRGYAVGDVIYVQPLLDANVDGTETIPSKERIAFVESIVPGGNGSIASASLVLGGYGYITAPKIEISPPTDDPTASASVDTNKLKSPTTSNTDFWSKVGTYDTNEMTSTTDLYSLALNTVILNGGNYYLVKAATPATDPLPETITIDNTNFFTPIPIFNSNIFYNENDVVQDGNFFFKCVSTLSEFWSRVGSYDTEGMTTAPSLLNLSAKSIILRNTNYYVVKADTPATNPQVPITLSNTTYFKELRTYDETAIAEPTALSNLLSNTIIKQTEESPQYYFVKTTTSSYTAPTVIIAGDFNIYIRQLVGFTGAVDVPILGNLTEVPQYTIVKYRPGDTGDYSYYLSLQATTGVTNINRLNYFRPLSNFTGSTTIIDYDSTSPTLPATLATLAKNTVFNVTADGAAAYYYIMYYDPAYPLISNTDYFTPLPTFDPTASMDQPTSLLNITTNRIIRKIFGVITKNYLVLTPTPASNPTTPLLITDTTYFTPISNFSSSAYYNEGDVVKVSTKFFECIKAPTTDAIQSRVMTSENELLATTGRYSNVPLTRGVKAETHPYMGIGQPRILRAGTGFSVGDVINLTTSGLIPAKISRDGLRIYNGGVGYTKNQRISIDSTELVNGVIKPRETTIKIDEVGGQVFSATVFNETAPFGSDFEVTDTVILDQQKDIRAVVTKVGGTGQLKANIDLSLAPQTIRNSFPQREVFSLVAFSPVLDYITVLDGGDGYENVPNVVFGRVSGIPETSPSYMFTLPTAIASLGLSTVTVANGGSGYNVGDDVIFTDARGGVGGAAEVSGVDDNGTILTLRVRSSGSGFAGIPVCNVSTSTGGSNATIVVTMKLVRIDVLTGGDNVISDANPDAGLLRNITFSLSGGPGNGPFRGAATDMTSNIVGSGAVVKAKATLNRGNNETVTTMSNYFTFIQLGGGYSPGNVLAMVPAGNKEVVDRLKFNTVTVMINGTFKQDIQGVDIITGYHGYANISGNSVAGVAYRAVDGIKVGQRITVPGFLDQYPKYTPVGMGLDTALSKITVTTPIPGTEEFLYHKTPATITVKEVDLYGGISAVDFTQGYGYTSIPSLSIPLDTTGAGAVLSVPFISVTRFETFEKPNKSGVTSGIGTIFNIEKSREYGVPTAVAMMNGDLQIADLNVSRNPNILEQLELAKPGSTTGYAHAIPIMGVGAVEVASGGQGYTAVLINKDVPSYKELRVEFTAPDQADGWKPVATANIGNGGKISTFTFSDPGYGYTKKPTMTVVWYDVVYTDRTLTKVLSQARSLDQATGSGFIPGVMYMTVLGTKVLSGGANWPIGDDPQVSIEPAGSENMRPTTSVNMKRAILSITPDTPGNYYTEPPEARVQGDGFVEKSPELSMCVSDVRIVSGTCPNLITKYNRLVFDCYLPTIADVDISYKKTDGLEASRKDVDSDKLAEKLIKSGNTVKYLDACLLDDLLDASDELTVGEYTVTVTWTEDDDGKSQDFVFEITGITAATTGANPTPRIVEYSDTVTPMTLPVLKYDWVVAKSDQHDNTVQEVSTDLDRAPNAYIAYVNTTYDDIGDPSYEVTSVAFGRIVTIPAIGDNPTSYLVDEDTSLANCGGFLYLKNPKVLGVISHTDTADEVVSPPSFSTRLGVLQMFLDDTLDKGSAFKSDPAIIIDRPQQTQQAAYTAGILDQKLDVLVPRTYGNGYVSVPNVTLSGGGGSGATVKAVMGVTQVDIRRGGKGYNVGDVVVFQRDANEPAATRNTITLPTAVVSSVDNGGSDLGAELTLDVMSKSRLLPSSFGFEKPECNISEYDPLVELRATSLLVGTDDADAFQTPLGMESIDESEATSNLRQYMVGDLLTLKPRSFESSTTAKDKIAAALTLLFKSTAPLAPVLTVSGGKLTKIAPASTLFSSQNLKTLKDAPYFRIGDYIKLQTLNASAVIRVCANSQYFDSGAYAADSEDAETYYMPSFPEYKMNETASYFWKSPSLKSESLYANIFEVIESTVTEGWTSGSEISSARLICHSTVTSSTTATGLLLLPTPKYNVTTVSLNGGAISTKNGDQGLPIDLSYKANDINSNDIFYRYLNILNSKKIVGIPEYGNNTSYSNTNRVAFEGNVYTRNNVTYPEINNSVTFSGQPAFTQLNTYSSTGVYDALVNVSSGTSAYKSIMSTEDMVGLLNTDIWENTDFSIDKSYTTNDIVVYENKFYVAKAQPSRLITNTNAWQSLTITDLDRTLSYYPGSYVKNGSTFFTNTLGIQGFNPELDISETRRLLYKFPSNDTSHWNVESASEIVMYTPNDTYVAGKIVINPANKYSVFRRTSVAAGNAANPLDAGFRKVDQGEYDVDEEDNYEFEDVTYILRTPTSFRSGWQAYTLNNKYETIADAENLTEVTSSTLLGTIFTSNNKYYIVVNPPAITTPIPMPITTETLQTNSAGIKEVAQFDITKTYTAGTRVWYNDGTTSKFYEDMTGAAQKQYYIKVAKFPNDPASPWNIVPGYETLDQADELTKITPTTPLNKIFKRNDLYYVLIKKPTVDISDLTLQSSKEFVKEVGVFNVEQAYEVGDIVWYNDGGVSRFYYNWLEYDPAFGLYTEGGLWYPFGGVEVYNTGRPYTGYAMVLYNDEVYRLGKTPLLGVTISNSAAWVEIPALPFSELVRYKIGEYVIDANKLYRCKSQPPLAEVTLNPTLYVERNVSLGVYDPLVNYDTLFPDRQHFIVSIQGSLWLRGRNAPSADAATIVANTPAYQNFFKLLSYENGDGIYGNNFFTYDGIPYRTYSVGITNDRNAKTDGSWELLPDDTTNPAAFDPTSVYLVDEKVTYNGNVYKAVQTARAPNVADVWTTFSPTTFSTTGNYIIGSIVKSGDTLYKSLQVTFDVFSPINTSTWSLVLDDFPASFTYKLVNDGTDQTPLYNLYKPKSGKTRTDVFNTTNWELVAVHSLTTNYTVGSYVKSGNSVYECLAATADNRGPGNNVTNDLWTKLTTKSDFSDFVKTDIIAPFNSLLNTSVWTQIGNLPTIPTPEYEDVTNGTVILTGNDKYYKKVTDTVSSDVTDGINFIEIVPFALDTQYNMGKLVWNGTKYYEYITNSTPSLYIAIKDRDELRAPLNTNLWTKSLTEVIYKTLTEFKAYLAERALNDDFGNILPNMLVNSGRVPFERLVSLPRGKITAITLTNFGSKFTMIPTCTIPSVDGKSGVDLVASLGVIRLEKTWPGSGYTSQPVVYIDYPLHISSTPEFLANAGAITEWEWVSYGNKYRETVSNTTPKQTLSDPKISKVVNGVIQYGVNVVFDSNKYTLNPVVDGTLHGLNFPDAVTATVYIRAEKKNGAGDTFLTNLMIADAGSNYRVGDVLEVIDNTMGGSGRAAKIRVTAVDDKIKKYPDLLNQGAKGGFYRPKNIGTGYTAKPTAKVVGGAQGITLSTSLSLVNVDVLDKTSTSIGQGYKVNDFVYAVSPEYQSAKLVGKVSLIDDDGSGTGPIRNIMMFTPYLQFTAPPGIIINSQTGDGSAQLVPSLGVSGIQITFSPDGFVGSASIEIEGPTGVSNGYIDASGSSATAKVFRDISRIVVNDNQILYDTIPKVVIKPPPNYDPASFIGWYAMYFNKGDALDTIVQYSIGKALSFQVDPDATLPGKYFVAESIMIGGVRIPLRAAGSRGAQGREMSANKVIHRYLVRYLAI